MIKYICDNCGKETKTISEMVTFYKQQRIEKHYCLSCCDKIIESITGTETNEKRKMT